MALRLTPWFPGDVRPARPGVYNASNFKDRNALRYWDGKYWSFWWTAKDPAFIRERAMKLVSGCRLMPWRGLSKEPK